LCYAWLKVLQPAFYAIDKRWLPMLVSILALGVNIGCNWFFVFVMHWGHASLALTTSISATLNFLILYSAMHRFAGGIDSGGLLALLGKLALAAAAMAAVCIAANQWWFADPARLPFWLRAGALAATIGLAAVVYFLAARLLRVAEARDALGMVVRKLRG
jgi:putative peptidoglycan lipid II flippase